jgi:uncharacterized protein YoxC
MRKIQKQFDSTLSRIDSLTTKNHKLQQELGNSHSEIVITKSQLRHLLSKSKMSAAELARAKQLIFELNGTIASFERQVQVLTSNNEQLTQDKNQLVKDTANLNRNIEAITVVNEYLGKKVDIASTFNASDIKITPIHVKRNGKEKVTDKATKVNKLIISFNISNLIDTTKKADIYVCISKDDKLINPEVDLTFPARDGNSKPYSTKINYNFEAGKKNFVEFAWNQNTPFQKGIYNIQIYHNGFKIGETTKELKNGIFGKF